MRLLPDRPAVVIVGAGPAGLAAAIELQRRGISPVVILERDDAAGGLPRFCDHPGFGWEYSWRLDNGPAFALRMLNQISQEHVKLLTHTTALTIRPGPEVEILGPMTGYSVLRPRAVLVATGIREASRGARFLPGSRPSEGIYTTGLLQQMVARGVSAGSGRCVIVGTEHVAFSAILTARKAGLQPVAMIEEAPRVQSFSLAAPLAQHLAGVAVHTSGKLVDIEGGERPSAVVVDDPSGRKKIPCETIVLTGEWRPETSLLSTSNVAIDQRALGPVIDQFMRTSLSGVFAAGNVLRGVETSGVAAIEGARAAATIAAYTTHQFTELGNYIPILVSDPVSYICPQRWAVGKQTNLGSILKPSLRILKDVQRARVAISVEDNVLWESRRMSLQSSRRLPLNLKVLDSIRSGTARVTVHE